MGIKIKVNLYLDTIADIVGTIFGSLIKMLIIYFVFHFIIRSAKLQKNQLFIVSLASTYIVDLILVLTVAKNFTLFAYDLLFIPVWMVYFFKNKVNMTGER